jgi:hypothetical protein
MIMHPSVKTYLAKIGRKGGKKSRRKLSPCLAKNMVKVREAKRAYRHFYAECFWSFDEHYAITLCDVDWVARQLRKNGNRIAWQVADKLCR